MSASKARVVLDLIRGKRVGEATEILEFTERLAAEPIDKCLRSAIANAEHNEDLSADDLFISACYADQGPTLKRFRPRARGRAGRIHKQTCHITIEVARLTDDELDELRKRAELKSEGRSRRSSSRAPAGGDRARRVARSRAAASAEDEGDDQVADDQVAEDQVAEDQVAEDQVAEDQVAEDQVADDDVAEEADTAEVEAEAPDEGATDEVAAEDDTDGDAGAKE
jgi:large subunit ribosomal protein L22